MSFRGYKARAPGSTKELVARTFAAAGGIKQVAFVLARSLTQTLSYTDPATDDEIKLDQLRRLVAATGVSEPARDLAALAGGVFLPAPAPHERFDLLAAETAKEWGEFTAILLRAHAEKKLHRLEGEILRRLDKLLFALTSARVQLVAERSEPAQAADEEP